MISDTRAIRRDTAIYKRVTGNSTRVSHGLPDQAICSCSRDTWQTSSNSRSCNGVQTTSIIQRNGSLNELNLILGMRMKIGIDLTETLLARSRFIFDLTTAFWNNQFHQLLDKNPVEIQFHKIERNFLFRIARARARVCQRSLVLNFARVCTCMWESVSVSDLSDPLIREPGYTKPFAFVNISRVNNHLHPLLRVWRSWDLGDKDWIHIRVPRLCAICVYRILWPWRISVSDLTAVRQTRINFYGSRIISIGWRVLAVLPPLPIVCIARSTARAIVHVKF